MPTAILPLNPTTFFKAARALEKSGASQEEWEKLRDRLQSYAMQHIDSYTRLSCDAALAVMRRFYQAYIKHSCLLVVKTESIECGAWTMAWWCLVRLVHETDTEKRPRYLKQLCFSLLVANSFAH